MTFPAAAYPERSQATTAFVMSILGILCCGPLSIVAWVMGNNELQGIQRGTRDPSNEGLGKAARIIGIIGTILFSIGIIVAVVFFSTGFTFGEFGEL